MRRFGSLLCLILIAGCGGGIESQIVGNWHVDPGSIQVSRLAPGADKKPEWADAKAVLGKTQVQFATDGTVSAIGFDMRSAAKWTLSGFAIKISGTAETWPEMVYDPNDKHIHLTEQQDGDLLKMDLVR